MNAVETPEVDLMSEAVREVDETPERATARSAAYSEARKRYPNHWAAVREVWDGERLAEPLVIAVGSSVGEIDEQLRTMPDIDLRLVSIRYLGPTVKRLNFHR